MCFVLILLTALPEKRKNQISCQIQRLSIQNVNVENYLAASGAGTGFYMTYQF